MVIIFWRVSSWTITCQNNAISFVCLISLHRFYYPAQVEKYIAPHTENKAKIPT